MTDGVNIHKYLSAEICDFIFHKIIYCSYWNRLIDSSFSYLGKRSCNWRKLAEISYRKK